MDTYGVVDGELEPVSDDFNGVIYYRQDDAEERIDDVYDLQESLIRKDIKIRDLERLRDGANDMLDRYSQLVDDWKEMYERLEKKHDSLYL